MINGFLSVGNALVLDRLIRTTKSNKIIFDSRSSNVIILLITDDFSHFTKISFENTFFSSLKTSNDFVILPLISFYKPFMRVMQIIQSKETTELRYELSFNNKAVKYRKIFYNLKKSEFDFKFKCWNSINVDFLALKNVLKRFRDDFIELRIGDKFEIIERNTKVILKQKEGVLTDSVNLSTLTDKFKVDLKTFKEILEVIDLFEESSFCLAGLKEPINIIFRNSNIIFSTYVSTM
ncbi:hypothetical protein A0H76_2321 [Hepatospora eriocheir]|uniref:Proliferating cell nuclear antigen n=1 Tax=Hepatospora eriocheir TaxID=1081669 RepID=A0A1X0QK55_9MICR|nr:hypothetical protein A0H76_2321 [Hepatospora eriocheir]